MFAIVSLQGYRLILVVTTFTGRRRLTAIYMLAFLWWSQNIVKEIDRYPTSTQFGVKDSISTDPLLVEISILLRISVGDVL